MAIHFEWDAEKAEANLRKHGVSFETAMQVFGDPLLVSVQDRIEGGERRWQTIGAVGGLILLLVAHTWRDDDGDEIIRIISARRADGKERKRYEQGGREAGDL